MKDTRKMTFTALFCALTTAATMIIRIPTPLFGYIHPGDAFVMLCGILISPVAGALAAGVGSMFADIFSGYLIYAPATFLIKAAAAFAAGYIYQKLKVKGSISWPKMLLACICSSAVVTGGYFLYEAFLFDIAASLANIPFNLIQNIFGIAITLAVYPIIKKIRGSYQTDITFHP